MLTRTACLFLLGLGITILLTGARTASLSTPLQNQESPFVPRSVPLDADIIGSGVDAGQLLQKALEKLDPQRTPWLKTKIRQTMCDVDSTFVAEGYLQRGPNHCARLEMDILSGGKKGRLIVVSDGELIAQVNELPGMPAKVDVHKLSITGQPRDDESTLKHKHLSDKSCGGPATLLAQLRRQLQNARLQTGLLQKTPVIQIKGDLEPAAMSVCAGVKRTVRQARVYLDAKTLWPHHVEWWGGDNVETPGLVLRIEFLDPQLNRELSVDECVRLFSYKPAEETGN
jgi:hypothetical protein